MPTSLTLDEHLDALRDAASALAQRAAAAGAAARVPTCPDWTIADLVAHLSMVHRWAAGHLLGHSDDEVPRTAALLALPDPAGYFEEGWQALMHTLRSVPADTDAMVFLLDAPRPREFWARRQAHETTIHAVDALSAQLGRLPTAAEAGLALPLAVDGIDELVCGFVPRGRSRWAGPVSCVIRPSDSDRRWCLTLAPEQVVATPGDMAGPDVTITGTAAEIYLGLWNRGAELHQSGTVDVLAHWQELQRVRWVD